MSKDLPPAKLAGLAESLSGKDCALLVIEYNNKEKKDGKNYNEEIKTIVATIPPYANDGRRQEYIFYWTLWSNFGFLSLDLQTNILSLKVTQRRLGIAESIFVSSCLIHHLSLTFRWIPKIYTPEQFEQVYKKLREEHLAEVMPLIQIVRHETFLKLQKEGFLDKDDDNEGVINWYEVDNYKTLEELISEQAKEIKDYLDDEEKRKKRGAIAAGEDIYTEYIGLSLDEIAEKVKQLGIITKSPEEEVKRWKKEVALEESKIRALIKEGRLMQGSVTDVASWYHNGQGFIGTEGITALSWYDFQDKLDKNFNKHIDDKNGLVEFCEGEFLIANGGGAGYVRDGETDCSAEKTRLRVIDQLKDYQTIKEDDEGYLDITSDELKSAFIARIEDAQKTIKLVKEHLEVIKRGKDELFDNVVEIADDLVREGESLIKKVVTDQEDTLDMVVKQFSLLAFFKDVKWKDKEKYKLNPDIEIDEEWVEKTIEDLIGNANKESGNNFKRITVLQSTKK
ncbi:MAG: hypothetical protein ACD_38C00169G0026 [uncultured bacterium]|uniref:Uncharacterized protein n=1 Tax=Candidatus Daviesbacteria bacterium GW2011_GWC2_40_12 TaxID=1618431 RepID=A0A0G0QP39_9BACT|nr:MAG: hypothetical protein ACD_38C00169G0026 [uncultured bacterium]KKQ84302.1 MAG: hypothetical protein UT04_C0018G0008 [Candidatus Daviesbacteria bacterium GW2011_GWF2_38_7]KKR15750.1 MAG: hypothetical protein UT45_C0014G0008 [Candidatus Daviesbacteria bacterium GW2011_GWA2_39_33]KKR24177.1 MAG: hypothetical protein UT54_C0027G0004 [Candidatus Daviesbacteria bacterium GW2011_GWB1_39_5]KKR41893.1 MAG: hypothetical protein UT77_C0005G0008 [Candidatus Daviesbacteria bacterium GW2011_GWC2_40_12]